MLSEPIPNAQTRAGGRQATPRDGRGSWPYAAMLILGPQARTDFRLLVLPAEPRETTSALLGQTGSGQSGSGPRVSPLGSSPSMEFLDGARRRDGNALDSVRVVAFDWHGYFHALTTRGLARRDSVRWATVPFPDSLVDVVSAIAIDRGGDVGASKTAGPTMRDSSAFTMEPCNRTSIWVSICPRCRSRHVGSNLGERRPCWSLSVRSARQQSRTQAGSRRKWRRHRQADPRPFRHHLGVHRRPHRARPVRPHRVSGPAALDLQHRQLLPSFPARDRRHGGGLVCVLLAVPEKWSASGTTMVCASTRMCSHASDWVPRPRFDIDPAGNLWWSGPTRLDGNLDLLAQGWERSTLVAPALDSSVWGAYPGQRRLPIPGRHGRRVCTVAEERARDRSRCARGDLVCDRQRSRRDRRGPGELPDGG